MAASSRKISSPWKISAAVGTVKEDGQPIRFDEFLAKVGPFKTLATWTLMTRKLIYFEAIINSMTREERENPRL
jgi:signal recognition particle GTPase